MTRRDFSSLALSSLALSTVGRAAEAVTPPIPVPARTGNGEWTFQTVPGWAKLPAGTAWGGTHGAVVSDRAGQVLVSTESGTGIAVFDVNGAYQGSIAGEFPAIHSMVLREEDGAEFLYCTHLKGKQILKLRRDGTVVWKFAAPAAAGYAKPDAWTPTATVVGPDGSVYVSDGYGDSRIHQFDRDGNYRKSFSGKGSADGQCKCSHGLALDTRYEQPLLLVCDRENRRLTHYDLDGGFVRNTTLFLRRPCQISFRGDLMAISELEGRVTILDKNNVPVAFLGDNADRKQWANYRVAPDAFREGVFTAPHGVHWAPDGALYVQDWNQTGRVTKLVKV